LGLPALRRHARGSSGGLRGASRRDAAVVRGHRPTTVPRPGERQLPLDSRAGEGEIRMNASNALPTPHSARPRARRWSRRPRLTHWARVRATQQWTRPRLGRSTGESRPAGARRSILAAAVALAMLCCAARPAHAADDVRAMVANLEQAAAGY